MVSVGFIIFFCNCIHYDNLSCFGERLVTILQNSDAILIIPTMKDMLYEITSNRVIIDLWKHKCRWLNNGLNANFMRWYPSFYHSRSYEKQILHEKGSKEMTPWEKWHRQTEHSQTYHQQHVRHLQVTKQCIWMVNLRIHGMQIASNVVLHELMACNLQYIRNDCTTKKRELQIRIAWDTYELSIIVEPKYPRSYLHHGGHSEGNLHNRTNHDIRIINNYGITDRS